MVGYAFMGAAHSQAWRIAPRFFDLPLQPRMAASPGGRRAVADGGRRGSAGTSTETDWQALVARDDVDLVDICTPGDTHAEIAIAALEAGKHVLCEKPLANSVEEAEAMAPPPSRRPPHGVRSMVGFTYRRVPAIALARQLVAEGRIGTVRHVRAPVPAGLDRRPAGARCRGGWTRARPAPARSATSARTSSTSPSSSPATPSAGSPAGCETFVDERPLPSEHAGLSGTARAPGTRHGHRRRRRDLPRRVPRRGAGRLRGHPLRQRPQERHPDRGQRLRRAASPSTSRT